MSGLVTIGETMGLFTAAEPGRRADRFRLGIGGAESNVAIGMARLGAHATWIGRVGQDTAGDLVRRELTAEGVLAHISVDESAPTGLMVKTQPLAGLSRVEYHRTGSAGSRLSPGDIDPRVIQGAGLVHVTGITPALSDSAAAAIETALDLAEAANVPISFDVNHRSALWRGRDSAGAYRAIARRATIVFAGADEAAMLVGVEAGTAPEALARAIADLGPSQVVIKLGAQGCLALADGATTAAGAIPVAAVDTVGAGDAFVAGYLAEYLEGSAMSERLAVAVRAGACACMAYGDWESLPHRADIALLDSIDPVIR